MPSERTTHQAQLTPSPTDVAASKKTLAVGAREAILNRSNIAEALLWIGLFAPAAINFEARSRASILAGGGLDGVSISRGIVPIACLVLALVLRRVSLRPLTLLEWLFLAYLAVALLSTVWSVSRFATLLKAINLLTAYLLIMVLARVHDRRRETLMQLVPILVLVLALSLAEFILVPEVAYKSTCLCDSTRRLMALFPVADPNSLAYIALVVILAVLTGTLPRLMSGLPARLSIGAAAIAVLLLTRSRAPLVILAGALVFLADQLGRLRRRLIVMACGAIGVALIIAYLVAPSAISGFVTRGEAAFAFVSLTGRTTTWRAAIDQWRHSPILGAGFYAGHRVGITFLPGAPEPDNVDNTWIETLVDVGVVGFLPLMGAVIFGAVLLFRRGPPSSSHRVVTCRRVVLLSALAASFVSPSLESPAYLMIIMSTCLLGAPRLRWTQEPAV